MSKNPPQLKSMLFICTFLTSSGVRAKTEPASTKITSRCLEAQYTTHLATDLEGRTTGLNQALTTLKQHLNAWKLLAQAAEAADIRGGAYLLASSAEEEVRRKEQEIQTYTDTIQTAVTRLRRRALYTAALDSIDYKKAAAAPTKGTGAASEFTCAQVFPATAASTKPDCKLDDLTTIFNGDKTLNLEGVHTIKLLTEESLAPPQPKVVSTAKGNQADYNLAPLTPGKCATSASGGADVYVKLDISADPSAKATAEPVQLHKPPGPGPNCIPEPDTKEQIITNNDYVIAAVCRALHASKPAISKPEDYGGDTIATNRANQQLFADYIAETTGEQMTKEQIEAKLKDMYSTKGNNFENNFIKTLNSVTATYTTEDKTKTGKLLEIAKDGNTVKAFAYLDARRTDTKKKADDGREKDGAKKTDTKNKTEEKKDGDNKTTTADCTGTEEGKCDKTKCDWNAEKKQCKVKEGAAVISAVIKAPLLLAVLLP
ncbi:variant surface glycoprotein (VSG, atypical), putative [Trypanosoma brucei brucei TREU927]|uniref:Variant surface glycoprotein (VSG, atypical), putative n=1 Tax=Trypanosoma brucei brucei (strain 927/4 GUTat10.1) TaxID=185431 RepID=Q57X40_TRYB2|nr:variant surface glycoprotein (VSG, atypical), putative [Trypanosoma brucei brucei TREU927]AAX69819.1 variant surface glycoprotein (VSG, atypical), putative [Trypanosoma brucei]AAZ11575.1 variant surface glycoprotein (VSG, atypical), putative [Trypanosoma brucei brucei TREU927]